MGIFKRNEITASKVAEWFLNKNNYYQNMYDTEDMTNLKLQKLLYYAQGIYLKRNSKPLFKEKILAWEHGPVIKEVYDQYKKFGGSGIIFEGNIDLNFPEEINEFLEEIYENFGQYTAWKLRNMTHEETPWLLTERNEEIPINLIEDFFKNTRKNYGM